MKHLKTGNSEHAVMRHENCHLLKSKVFLAKSSPGWSDAPREPMVALRVSGLPANLTLTIHLKLTALDTVYVVPDTVYNPYSFYFFSFCS